MLQCATHLATTCKSKEKKNPVPIINWHHLHKHFLGGKTCISIVYWNLVYDSVSFVPPNTAHKIRPCLVAGCKVFERESFYIWSTKHRLIIKLITELVCKSRDESIEPN